MDNLLSQQRGMSPLNVTEYNWVTKYVHTVFCCDLDIFCICITIKRNTVNCKMIFHSWERLSSLKSDLKVCDFQSLLTVSGIWAVNLY